MVVASCEDKAPKKHNSASRGLRRGKEDGRRVVREHFEDFEEEKESLDGFATSRCAAN